MPCQKATGRDIQEIYELFAYKQPDEYLTAGQVSVCSQKKNVALPAFHLVLQHKFLLKKKKNILHAVALKTTYLFFVERLLRLYFIHKKICEEKAKTSITAETNAIN